MHELVAGAAGPALLLGVTPEYAALTAPLTAIDWNQAMIDHVWPGDGNGRAAVCGDWLNMAFPPASFSIAFGDGSLNMLRFPDQVKAVVDRLRVTVREGGGLAFRCFCAPERAASAQEVQHAAFAGRYGFHELKWRVATLLAHDAPDWNVEGRAILAAFDRLFPDRAALGAATGWPLATIAEIDDYSEARWTMSFPPRRAFETLFADLRWVESGEYQMANLCPILVIDL